MAVVVMQARQRPIGVFDSGVGGLSVLREIRSELPHENLMYVADSGHAPYGDKAAEFIEQRALAIAAFLVREGAKALVVACNTATGVAVDAIRAHWALPVVAIEPAIKPAAVRTRSGVVGVLATSQTIASARFARLVERHHGGATILAQSCPGLAEFVERGELSGPATRSLVARCVVPLLEKGADTLVLGCTHYPFVVDEIRSVAGPDVEIIDPSRPVARELRRRLEENDLLTDAMQDGWLRGWSSGVPDHLRDVMGLLGFGGVDVHRL